MDETILIAAEISAVSCATQDGVGASCVASANGLCVKGLCPLRHALHASTQLFEVESIWRAKNDCTSPGS